MKKILFAGIVGLLLAGKAFASWDNGNVTFIGQYVETEAVTITTHTAGTLYTADVWDLTIDIFNNTAFTLWIGTDTTTLATTGLPILSSTTYTIAGQFVGSIYGLMDPDAGGDGDVRIIHYKRNPR